MHTIQAEVPTRGPVPAGSTLYNPLLDLEAADPSSNQGYPGSGSPTYLPQSPSLRARSLGGFNRGDGSSSGSLPTTGLGRQASYMGRRAHKPDRYAATAHQKTRCPCT